MTIQELTEQINIIKQKCNDDILKAKQLYAESNAKAKPGDTVAFFNDNGDITLKLTVDEMFFISINDNISIGYKGYTEDNVLRNVYEDWHGFTVLNQKKQ